MLFRGKISERRYVGVSVTERQEQLGERKAVLREQNALPTTRLLGVLFAAKDAIDNGGAGRAAKGGNPLLCANEKHPFRGVFFCGFFRI